MPLITYIYFNYLYLFLFFFNLGAKENYRRKEKLVLRHSFSPIFCFNFDSFLLYINIFFSGKNFYRSLKVVNLISFNLIDSFLAFCWHNHLISSHLCFFHSCSSELRLWPSEPWTPTRICFPTERCNCKWPMWATAARRPTPLCPFAEWRKCCKMESLHSSVLMTIAPTKRSSPPPGTCPWSPTWVLGFF